MSETIIPLLTVSRAAAIVQCHPETIRRAIRNGRLAAYRRPGCTRISETDLKAYLDTYHCPATEMTSPTWNYVAANGPSSGGRAASVTAALQVARMKRSLVGS
ncbi:hypothetical protein AA12717_0296 [Gluconacetobacter sacchari DSM 12717]|uniref:Helix-turn-helix domain-containing protein n=2 Tax=Gluconacetobacter sacchari TaxID=92759 RepID=A0A7W4IAU9_9PROT|nr:helix-turn-helix domain-containing protein [Gluconacetobacter sacchari]GBQ19573.1 hypothetical protein AA12717_0296 [Gluconacetobacter sacchari DSM 12717]